MTSERRLLGGALLIVVAATFFGTLGPVSRFAYDAGVTPLGFTAWRALIGATVLGVALLILRRRGERLVDLRELPRSEAAALVTTAVATTLVNLAIFVAFQRITIALALLAFYTYPAMVGAVAAFTGRERLDASRLVALGLALGGMALVVLGQLGTAGGDVQLDVLGLALAFVGAGANVIYLLAARGGFPSLPPRQATFSILFISEICFVAIALVTGTLASIAEPLGQPAAWPDLLFAGIAGAAFPSVLLLAGVRRIGAVRTSILMLLEPVVGVVLAALLLGETLIAIQVFGGALVLAGAALAQRNSRDVADSGLGPAVVESAAG
ncbi:MAG: EamA family transporter [Candidatus Limnocylindrales bacterium]